MIKRFGMLAFTVLGVATLIGGVLGNQTKEEHPFSRFYTYTQLLHTLQRYAASTDDPENWVYASIRAMLTSLDPHSYFLTPEEYRAMQRRQQGRFSGLGIMVSKRDDRIIVVSPIEGTPAYRLGIRAGDVIIRVDSKSIEGLTIDQVVDLLRGPEGSKVTVTIQRVGVEKLLEFTITREVIPETSVRYATLLPGKVAYVRITEFNRTTAEELHDKLSELLPSEPSCLLLDLRGNPGGLLDQAVAVADLFLREGAMVVYTKGRAEGTYQEYRAPGMYEPLDLPTMVLVDQGSASASEIVAGALQDHDRALIIGTPTFGKGLVQSVFELHHQAALALTTAHYYTPSGRSIQRPYQNIYTYVHHRNGKGLRDVVYRTDHGREVFGGGGIHPDILLKEIQYPQVIQQLLAHGSFFNFSYHYASDHIIEKDFQVTQDVINAFIQFIKEKEILEDEEALRKEENRPFLNYFLKRELLTAEYGLETGNQAVLLEDQQIKKALDYREQAEALWKTYSGSS